MTDANGRGDAADDADTDRDRDRDAVVPDRTETADVVVAGCGPGGAVLSFLLARSGVDVTLVERAATFEREYRGFGWNPGVVRLFDEMDLLDDVLDLAHETVREGTFAVAGEPVSVLDFDLLDTDYPYALLMEQPALLELLVERAGDHDEFAFRPSTTVTDLRRDADGAVCGVVARDRAADEVLAVDARVVVGADGRYSTVRSAADIDSGAFDSPIDLVWFTLPAGAAEPASQGQIGPGAMLVHFGLGAGRLQVGYPVLDGAWPAIREAGFDAFRERVAAVDPAVAAAMATHLDGFADTTLLDVAPGLAPEWTRDGLVLLGDAAHTASPVGAQGNPLAVEDAVVLHDVLAGALVDGDGPLPAAVLRPFERARRPTVERVIALQRRAGRGMAAWLRYGRYVPPPAVRAAATAFGRVAAHSRRARRPIEAFALGDRSVTVARDRFLD
ncbi:FAD-dependent monooxygenase [Halobaculum lipolyticum]|uniref:FAD-dependent monooxygenase n=1 Tax=Halobaculum lipolyticum TaxID=3032001 RepID=A0ABD5W9K8_9EURY|nr:FAD-dependent monooxygenase [Halobaculum sp. DT31]